MNAHQARYILLISELLNASSHAVKYEAATTLTSLTQNPAAVKGELTCVTHECVPLTIRTYSCCVLLCHPRAEGFR